jgi:hypothetical protein
MNKFEKDIMLGEQQQQKLTYSLVSYDALALERRIPFVLGRVIEFSSI